MSALLRQFRRAPGRITASILALALAIGAIGILAVPTVSESTLHEAVGRDGLADIIVDTTPLDDEQLDAVDRLDGVTAAEGQAIAAVRMDDGFLTRMIGVDFEHQTMDLVQLTAGRLPTASDEVVTSPALGAIGDEVVADGVGYRIVGHGSTLWWSGDDVLYAPYETVSPMVGGANHLVVTADDDGEPSLRSLADEIRTTLAASGGALTTFPELLPDGSTPIDGDIEQISTLIGLLGIFAGLVALVLLAGTTNTLITERTREVAVMRALGGRARPLRRRLRRIALGITGVALLIGIPFGILISNYVARMVLEEFVGVTPSFAVDWVVVGASAVAALVAARIVSARAARRVTKLSLPEALRDRDGAPFGGRWSHRLLTKLPTGGLLQRIATRSSARRPARTLAVTAQIAAAVAAAFLIPTLITSVNDFNSATLAPWTWESIAIARDPGLQLPADDDLDVTGESEAGIWTEGAIGDSNLNVYGLRTDSRFLTVDVRSGRWFGDDGREAMISDGFATRRDVEVGDVISLELANGYADYEIVGTVDDSNLAVYADRDDLAADLGAPGMANVVWSTSAAPRLAVDAAIRVDTAADLAAEDEAGRDAVVLIFGAIGVIVAGVAALAVLSTMTVDLFERRHELAALQAVGARRRRLRGLLTRELLPVGAVGTVIGIGLGGLGARGIIGSFEQADGIDIGVTDAVGAIPFIVAGTVVVLYLLAAAVVRTTAKRSIAVTLRGAA